MVKTFRFIFFIFITFSNSQILVSQSNIDSLKKVISTSSNEKDLMTAYNDYAFFMYRVQVDSAIYYAEKALEIAEKFENKVEIQAAYNVIGLTYQVKGMTNLAVDYFSKALEYESHDEINKAKIFHNMGLAYLGANKKSDALKYELEAIKILELEKDSVFLGVVYQSICNIYREIGDFAQAEMYILKSIQILDNIQISVIESKKSLLANSYNAYGNLLQVSGKLNEAIERHKQAIEVHHTSGDLFNKAIAYENLGDDYLILKKYQDAILQYEAAKNLMQQINSEIDVGYEIYKIAEVYKQIGQLDFALQKLDTAFAIYEKNGSDSYKLDVLKMKYEIYDLKKDASTALKFYKAYISLKDSLNVQAQNKEVYRLKEEFETTKKEQRIKLLESENALTDKEKQQQILFRNIAIGLICVLLLIGFLLWNRYRITQKIKQLEMRNTIAIDLHDEVGSSLSSIKMLSEIASVQNKDQNQLNEILQKIQMNAKETAEKMHDIIWMINPKNDKLENMLQRMEKFLQEIALSKNIHATFENTLNENLRINMHLRKNVLLIFKEAVNNAVKYSDAKTITTSIQEINKLLLLTVKDNGKGFNIQHITPGNGLDSMQLRAKELNGTFHIESSENLGTEITISIPLD